jgi:hypothetical protein
MNCIGYVPLNINYCLFYKHQQLRGAQILDAVRLHKQGFPKFLPLSEFRRRFRLLAPADGRPASPVLDERRAVEDMLLGIEIDMASYRVGLSQVGASCNFSDKPNLKCHTNLHVKKCVLLIIFLILIFRYFSQHVCINIILPFYI